MTLELTARDIDSGQEGKARAGLDWGLLAYRAGIDIRNLRWVSVMHTEGGLDWRLRPGHSWRTPHTHTLLRHCPMAGTPQALLVWILAYPSSHSHTHLKPVLTQNTAAWKRAHSARPARRRRAFQVAARPGQAEGIPASGSPPAPHLRARAPKVTFLSQVKPQK